MAKTLTAAMTTHINRDVTTLATLWQVTRLVDSVVLRVTDHDQDIVFGGNTYAAASGVARTSMESKSDFAVDNLEVNGILGGIIEEADLRDGYFDFAEIRISLVNWQDPDGFGEIVQRVGNLGEIRLNDTSYEAEMRGLTQLLSRRRGAVYTPDCQVDLFDPIGCKLLSSSFVETAEVDTLTDRREFKVAAQAFNLETPLPTAATAVMNQVVYRSGTDALTMQVARTDGTPLRAQVVTTPAELDAIRNDLSGYYILGNDIDMGAFGDFEPIGRPGSTIDAGYKSPFSGVFDGRGHRIFNLRVRDGVQLLNCGMFGGVTGIIKNVGLINCDSDAAQAGANHSATLVAVLLNDFGANAFREGRGTIQDCYAIGGNIDTGSVAPGRAGGIAGFVSSGAIVRRCYAAVPISGTIESQTGSIIAFADGSAVLSDLFYNSAASGTTAAGSGVTATDLGVTEADYLVEANYTSFDFTDLFKMNDGTFVDGGGNLTFADANPDTITRTTGSWLTDEIWPHEDITITGTVSNNSTFKVRTVTATVLTLDAAETLAAEVIAGSSVTLTSSGAPRLFKSRV